MSIDWNVFWLVKTENMWFDDLFFADFSSFCDWLHKYDHRFLKKNITRLCNRRKRVEFLPYKSKLILFSTPKNPYQKETISMWVLWKKVLQNNHIRTHTTKRNHISVSIVEEDFAKESHKNSYQRETISVWALPDVLSMEGWPQR